MEGGEPELIASRDFVNLEPNQRISVFAERVIGINDPVPDYGIHISYDPDIFNDGNERNDDCKLGNNRLVRATLVVGRTIKTPDGDCNACGENLLDQITGSPRLDISEQDAEFAIPHSRIQILDKFHIQGVGRLRDVGAGGRMVITDNGIDCFGVGPAFRCTSTEGLTLATQRISPGADEALYSSDHQLRDTVKFKIMSVPEYGNHDHPGGLQTQGDLIAVTMEGAPSDGPAAIYFLRALGTRSIRYLGQLTLDGSNGEPAHVPSSRSAATVGFIQLGAGNYLLAVSGAKHGSEGLWFYESTGIGLDSDTEWKFRRYIEDPPYRAAGGGLNFATDCSGALYLFAMHGTNGDAFDDEFEYLEVFRVAQNLLGLIRLEKVADQSRNLGRASFNNQSFRWSGGVYVSESGQVAVMKTERGTTRSGDRDDVDGTVHFGKRSR